MVLFIIFRIWLLSIMTINFESRDDMVVREAQNPISTMKEYLRSKIPLTHKKENIPKIKLQVAFTINRLN